MKKIFIVTTLFLQISTSFALSPALEYNDDELQWANFMAQSSYIVDYSNSPEKYRLNDSITRREVMKVIANIAGAEFWDTCEWKFSDVKSSDWGCKYIERALSIGIVANNTNFRPNDSISKAEALKMLLKVRGVEKTSDTGNWQADYVKTAFSNKWYETEWSDYNTAASRGWIFMSGNRIINNIQVEQIWEIDDTQAILDELFDFLK